MKKPKAILRQSDGILLLAASAAIILVLAAGCAKKQSVDPATYGKEITEWQTKRSKSISSENSWLTLAGLYWLKPGENTFGSDSSDQIILPPGKIPPVAGSIDWKDSLLTLTAKPGAGVTVHDSAITKIRLHTDTEGSPTVVALGSVSFYVIRRGDQLGIRVKDKENAARKNFMGLDFFPANPGWRIEGKYEAFPSPKVVPITSVIGTVENDTFPGSVVFTKDGKDFRLIAQTENDPKPMLYFMFSDETGGKETYGLGRQLSVPMPDSTGMVVMDFNKAYNWPCAYTDFATCPIPPRENHLMLRVEAGEKKYPGHDNH
jgi:uncharacterized protein